MMLSFRICLDDLSNPSWSWSKDRWLNGGSWIRPLVNPLLEWQLAYDDSGQACVVVRERDGSGASGVFDGAVVHHVPDIGVVVESMRSSSGEYAAVEMRPGWARVSAGQFGTAPLYLAERADVLAGSWNLVDLHDYLDPARLLDRAVVRVLTRQQRYSSDTLFDGVHRITERATATFIRAQLCIAYPAPVEHVLQARELRPGVDLVAAFRDVLEYAVARIAIPSEGVGLELSGGADSANVGLTLTATRDCPIRSYGLRVGGAAGEQQRLRRAALVQRLGLIDTEIPAERYPPFVPGGIRATGVPHDPAAAYYREAFDALCDAAKEGDVSVIFTGFGGDEVNALHPHEHVESPVISAPVSVPWLGPRGRAALPDIDINLAPVSAVPLPSLMAFSLHNPAYLQAGIWPVAPLAHPMIGRFTEQLPVRWRQGKALFRQRLRQAGLSDEIAEPRRPENFSSLMQVGLRNYGLPLLRTMLKQSLLVELGYLEHHALACAYEAATRASSVPSILCDALALDRGLQSLA